MLDLKALTGDKEDTSDQLRFAVQTTINDTDFSLGTHMYFAFNYLLCVFEILIRWYKYE